MRLNILDVSYLSFLVAVGTDAGRRSRDVSYGPPIKISLAAGVAVAKAPRVGTSLVASLST